MMLFVRKFIIKKLATFLYDFLISRFLTVTSHIIMIFYMTKLSGSFLDVGTGTGLPLQAIIHSLKTTYSKIVGVDLDPDYTA
jgi:16S rRNA G527 N7-methylase RsmG